MTIPIRSPKAVSKVPGPEPKRKNLFQNRNIFKTCTGQEPKPGRQFERKRRPKPKPEPLKSLFAKSSRDQNRKERVFVRNFRKSAETGTAGKVRKGFGPRISKNACLRVSF